MSYSTSILTYNDVAAVLDRALAAEKGIRLEFHSQSEATRFYVRIAKFRALDRAANKRIYPEGDPLHGCSPYDVLRPVKPRPPGKDWQANAQGMWPVEIRKLSDLEIMGKIEDIE